MSQLSPDSNGIFWPLIKRVRDAIYHPSNVMWRTISASWTDGNVKLDLRPSSRIVLQKLFSDFITLVYRTNFRYLKVELLIFDIWGSYRVYGINDGDWNTRAIVPYIPALIIATLESCSHRQSFQFANLALKSYFQFLTTNSTSFALLCPCGDYYSSTSLSVSLSLCLFSVSLRRSSKPEILNVSGDSRSSRVLDAKTV